MNCRMWWRYALVVAALAAAGGCGKKGPLVYPDLLVPAAPAPVDARQAGDAVRLSFVLPGRDMAGRKYETLAGVRIFKRDEQAAAPPGCSACSDDFLPFRTLELQTLPADVERSGRRLTLLDRDVRAGRRYTYRIIVRGGDGSDGAPSAAAMVAVEPASPAPALQVISHPTELVLEFVALPAPGVKPIGFHVYRAVKGTPLPLVPLTVEPVAGNRYVDQAVERNVTYVYAVRTVIGNEAGGLRESGASNLAEGMLKNDE